jgi:hypothetical protein
MQTETNWENEYENATELAYWKSVSDIADAIVAEHRDGDEHDAVHEAVDGIDWVIYTWRCLRVLQYTRNDDAIFDAMGRGAFDGCDSMGAIYTRAAFWALYQDVTEELADARQRLDDASIELAETEPEIDASTGL